MLIAYISICKNDDVAIEIDATFHNSVAVRKRLVVGRGSTGSVKRLIIVTSDDDTANDRTSIHVISRTRNLRSALPERWHAPGCDDLDKASPQYLELKSVDLR